MTERQSRLAGVRPGTSVVAQPRSHSTGPQQGEAPQRAPGGVHPDHRRAPRTRRSPPPGSGAAQEELRNTAPGRVDQNAWRDPPRAGAEYGRGSRRGGPGPGSGRAQGRAVSRSRRPRRWWRRSPGSARRARRGPGPGPASWRARRGIPRPACRAGTPARRGPRGRPVNGEQPADVPVRPGPVGHLVIARLVWAAGEEWVPAVTNRRRWRIGGRPLTCWSCGTPAPRAGGCGEVATWLRAADVPPLDPHATRRCGLNRFAGAAQPQKTAVGSRSSSSRSLSTLGVGASRS